MKRASSLTKPQLKKLAESTLAITRRSLETGGVTLDAVRAKRLLREGISRRQRRHYVFGRAGQSCFVCETIIERIDVAGRAVFVCPQCQGMRTLTSPA